MHVAVGQIWIQAAPLDGKQGRERNMEKKQGKEMQTISIEHQIHAGQIDGNQ